MAVPRQDLKVKALQPKVWKTGLNAAYKVKQLPYTTLPLLITTAHRNEVSSGSGH